MATSGKLALTARYYRNYPPLAPLGLIEETLWLDPRETVFMLVDVYGLGYDPDAIGHAPEIYQVAFEPQREVVAEHIRPAKQAAKRAGLPIVYLTNYLAPSTDEHTEWRNMSLRTCGVDVLEAWKEPNDILAFSRIIAPEEGDHLIKKQMYSGFFETHLDSLLRTLNARDLIVVGFDTEVCLGSTVTEAMYRNYRVIVLRDCCHTPEYPETAGDGWANWLSIRFIEANVGYTSTSESFVQSCAALSAGGVDLGDD